MCVHIQLAVEVEEKEAILNKMNKQSKTMNKMKRGESLDTPISMLTFKLWCLCVCVCVCVCV